MSQKRTCLYFFANYKAMVKTKKVVMLFESGIRKIEIATMLRVTPETIRLHLRKGGIKPRNGRPPSRPIGPRISYARAGVI